ncbi:hypothetical protein, variant [Allomyces macrogynus ATCC 38327]|uniref:CID domain-containing protein n=1 Tax=Allomyces macrogynus (strain ATCC 38327) TaxID=578462 RepID=A0A0L0T794_ALLM3|nr:hypothetical protein, variant [Allomyces macrogynus ATCC 38327]|eukprot:KNE70678.1 hypothetical protein, variant [Allomyces macrogynus ATCC 38327]
MVDYDRDLRAVLDSRPPISASRVQSLTKAALKHAQSPDLVATVAYLVARFVRKCPPEFKLSGLYLVDSICRASLAQFKDKDLYVRQFLGLLPGLTPEIAKGPDKDRERVKKLLDVWRANKVFPSEFLDKAHTNALASPAVHHASSPHVDNGHASATPAPVSVSVPVPGTAPPAVAVSGPPAPPLIDPSALLQSLTTALTFGNNNKTATPPQPMFTSSTAAAPPTIVLPSLPLPAAPASAATADPSNPLAAMLASLTGTAAPAPVPAPITSLPLPPPPPPPMPLLPLPGAAGRMPPLPPVDPASFALLMQSNPLAMGLASAILQQQGMPGGLVPPPPPMGADGVPPPSETSGLVGEWVQVEGGCGPNQIKGTKRLCARAVVGKGALDCCTDKCPIYALVFFFSSNLSTRDQRPGHGLRQRLDHAHRAHMAEHLRGLINVFATFQPR